VRADKKTPLKSDKKATLRGHKRGVVGYSKKSALLEDAITQMNAGKYGRSSAALKELLALDPHNMEARRLFATLHLRLGSLIPARQAFDSLINEAFERQDYWLAESLLREYLAAGPRCVPFLEKLGSIYQEKGDTLEAVAEYGKAIQILIEDPDPDNPHYASQLYTKIRDLAPASPIAFRLASSFDAQTGELVARPPAAHGEAGVAPPPSSAVEDIPAVPSIPEPIAGLMPWDQVEDAPEISGFAPVQEPARPSEFPTSPVGTDALSREERSPSDTSQSFDSPMVEQNEISLNAQTEVGTEAQEAIRLSASVEAFTAEKAPDLMPGLLHHEGRPSLTPSPDSILEVPATHHESESVSTRSDDSMPPPEFLSQGSDSPSSQIRQETGAEVVSAPMPWEDVRESTISIPDHVPDSPLVSSTPTEAVSTIPLLRAESSGVGRDGSCEVAPSPSAFVETSQNAPPAEEPGTTSSTSVPDQTPVGPESLKGGGFSWETIFNSAWKFGDKPSPSASTLEATEADTTQIEGLPASTISSLHAEVPEAESIEIQETNREQSPSDSTLATSAAAPMPWDQVQESVITIPSARLEETVPESPIVQAVQSAGQVEPVQALYQEPAPEQAYPEPFISSTSSVSGTDSFSITQPPPAPSSSEPDFLSHDSAPILSIEENQTTSVGAEQPSSASASISELLKLVEPILVAPPSFSTSLSAPAVEVAPKETQPENLSAPLKEENVEPVPSPQSITPEPFAESTQVPSRSDGDILRWKTGEVAVQTHRPSKKRKKISEPVPETPVAPVSSEETAHREAEQNEQREVAFAEARARIPESMPQQEEWIRTGESIRFVEQPQVSSVTEAPPQAPVREETRMSQPEWTAAAAVDVLFDSSSRITRTETRERVAEPKPRPKLRSKLNRIRIGITVFISSCFSTTRAIVTSLVALVVLSGALVTLGIGVMGLTWVVMEKQPSPIFQSLTTSPQRTLSDFKKNGYLLLLGFDAPAGQDPIQAGYEKKPDTKDTDMAFTCLGASGGGTLVGQSNASANVASGWFRGSDPVGQFKAHQDTIRGWVNQGQSVLGRYKQWQKLSFEDWGYGQTLSPPCASIVFAHQLSLADGFVQATDVGVDRLETDMEAWRIALGQAKTLPVKMLALQAINDDVAVASGLIVRPDFDGKYLGRVTKMLRPLDQVELSIRWPMQSELVSATRIFDAQLKAERREEQALLAVVASVLPLPKQRRFNDYAEYYEASYKAAGEGRHGSLPKWKNYIHFPANTVMDYLTNPIENIVGLEPLAPWDLYNGLVVDTDAHLRLASLQAWLRRGPQDADLMARIAKAGQNFYDPYTGLPMLVNLKKGVLYSVGHDGKDQDADPQSDVVVAIPVNQASTVSAKSPFGPSKSK
jgi:hypothetical protein